jgi:hypothetical protein
VELHGDAGVWSMRIPRYIKLLRSAIMSNTIHLFVVSMGVEYVVVSSK